MNSRLFIILLVNFPAFLPSTVLADRYYRQQPARYSESAGLYLGLNAGPFSSSETDASLAGAVMKLGFEFDAFFAVEAHLGGSDWKNYGSTDYEERIGGMSGVYLRANVPFERHELYALLGYSHFNFESNKLLVVTGDGEFWENTTFDRGAASAGVGLDLSISPRSALNIQYMQYLPKTDTQADLNQFSVGMRFRFY